MNTPDLRQLRHFIAVAERLHFGRAAAALHMSQPPRSRSIRDRAGRVGATLLARTRRRVELTPEGARFLEEAKRLLAQLERVVLEVGGMAAGAGGRLRLGFVSLADYGVLPGLLKSYKAARPGVALALREMLSPDQAAALAAGDLDFGLLLPPSQERIWSMSSCNASALSPRYRPGTGLPANAAGSRCESSPTKPSSWRRARSRLACTISSRRLPRVPASLRVSRRKPYRCRPW